MPIKKKVGHSSEMLHIHILCYAMPLTSCILQQGPLGPQQFANVLSVNNTIKQPSLASNICRLGDLALDDFYPFRFLHHKFS